MRLVTRLDFDGLACGALLKAVGVIDNWLFTHPKDLQDGLVKVTKDDCLVNVPYVKGCGMWFDHHTSEDERNKKSIRYKGKSDSSAPSCARVIYDYYGGKEKFPQFNDLIEAIDKVDSGNLTQEDIQNPKGWVMIGFLIDPRTGFGRFKDFRLNNVEFIEMLLEKSAVMTIEEILELQDLKERIEMYNKQTHNFKVMLKDNTRVVGKLLITDLRNEKLLYTGNRFLIYSLYPEQNISVWITKGRNDEGISCAIGYSVLNRTATLDVGHLCLKYKGGGHKQVGTCQFHGENAQENMQIMLKELSYLANS